MRFRDKDGKVVESLQREFSYFCSKQGCPYLCPVGRAVAGSSETCDAWANNHPAEFARLLGYEVVEDDTEQAANKVTVRWFDGYMEEFEASEVRFGSELLWMRLVDGKNRHIPLRQVRWFGLSQESHQRSDSGL